MPTQKLIKTPILISQYQILTPKPGINNNDASSIKKLIVALFSEFFYIGVAIAGLLFFIYKNKKH